METFRVRTIEREIDVERWMGYAHLDQFLYPFSRLHECERGEKNSLTGSRIRFGFVSIDLANKEGVEEDELIVGNHKLN